MALTLAEMVRNPIIPGSRYDTFEQEVQYLAAGQAHREHARADVLHQRLLRGQPGCFYEGLLAVSREGDWTGWSRFFPGAVRDQAEANLSRTRAIMELYETMKVQVVDLTHSQYAVHVPDWVFGRPIFKSSDFVAGAGIPEPTAKRILAVLRNEGVVSVISAARGRRAAALAFPGLLNIAEGRDAF